MAGRFGGWAGRAGWVLLAVLLGWLGGGSGGEAGEGLGGEVAAGDGGEQVVDGDDEGPLGGCLAVAAQGQLAEAEVVLDVAVGGLGDVAALPVGGDAAGGGQPGGHGSDGAFLAVSCFRVAGAGGFLQVAVLAGGDEPVRAGAGEVGVGEVAGVGEDQADLRVPAAA